MDRSRRVGLIWLVPAVVAALASGTGRSADTPSRCCFSNERYAGVCAVVPEPDTTCEDVLAYLNNPNSVGKTYCGATDIRGGWVQVGCSDATPSPSIRSARRTEGLASPSGDARPRGGGLR